jgi:hypothetical protein
MRPEDEALLARVAEPRRGAVREALEELQRIREGYGNARDEELPPEVRERGLAALRLVRRETEGGLSWPVFLVSLLLLAVGAGVAFFAPGAFYSFAPERPGTVRCVVRSRVLGLLPAGSEVHAAVESAEGASGVTSESVRQSSGRTKSHRVTVRTLRLRDAGGSTVHERTVQYPIGMDPEEVAPAVAALARGESREPFVRWVFVWPALLVATLFGYLGFEMAWQTLGASARLSDAAALRFLFGPVVTVPLRALLLAAFVAAWGIAFVGGVPPAWLVALLGVGH